MDIVYFQLQFFRQIGVDDVTVPTRRPGNQVCRYGFFLQRSYVTLTGSHLLIFPLHKSRAIISWIQPYLALMENQLIVVAFRGHLTRQKQQKVCKNKTWSSNTCLNETEKITLLACVSCSDGAKISAESSMYNTDISRFILHKPRLKSRPLLAKL